jgi:importin subunit beta-1
VPFILQLVPHLLDRLQKTFSMPVLNADDKEEQNEQQALLCSVLQVRPLLLWRACHTCLWLL